METRIAVIGIVVENQDSANQINDLLHTYASYIIGRMGVPYKERGVSVISIIMDAPQNEISALSGKLGMLPDVTSKAVYTKVIQGHE